MNKEQVFYKKMLADNLPSKEAVRSAVLEGSRTQKKKTRWMVPVAACILGAVVICTAVPPVRAAISQWFSDNFSVENYIAQPSGARPSTPELDTLIEQTAPEAAGKSLEFVNAAPEWQEWAESLDPTVNDIIFDGKELIVSFDMGGGAPEFIIPYAFTDMGIESFERAATIGESAVVSMNGQDYAFQAYTSPAWSEQEKYGQYRSENSHPDAETPEERGEPITGEGVQALRDADSVLFTTTIDMTLQNDYAWLDDVSQEDYDNWMAVMDAHKPGFDPDALARHEGELTGVQNVEIYLPIYGYNYDDVVVTEDESGMTIDTGSQQVALMKLAFDFDPQAGYASTKSYDINQSVEFTGEGTFRWADRESEPGYVLCTNKTMDLSGVTMTAKRMDVYPSGVELYVSITCPDNWDETDKSCFLNSIVPRTLGDGVQLQSTGEQYGLEEGGEDMGMCIYLNMLPSEVDSIDTFEIVPIVGYYTGYDSAPYVEGEITRIPEDEFTGWQEESAELTQCALTFNLK